MANNLLTDSLTATCDLWRVDIHLQCLHYLVEVSSLFCLFTLGVSTLHHHSLVGPGESSADGQHDPLHAALYGDVWLASSHLL